MIAEARNGLFPRETVETSLHNYQQSGGRRSVQKYFEQRAAIFKIQAQLRDRILFFQHSLVNSGVLNEFQLIVCRNVLIYFTPALQRKVLTLFSQSLTRNGFLMLGESESLTGAEGNARDFEIYDRTHKIYRKRRSEKS